MTLTELQTAVYEITNRPDLVAKTLSAVQSATLKAHHSDYYYKDIYEAEVDFTTELYEPDFEFRTFVPRWRAAKYFRKYNHTTGVPGIFFDKISPENALDSYAQAQTNVWYGAGEIIHFKSSTEERYILMGCYRHPDITIGKTEEMRALKEEFSEQMILLRNANVLENGE
jgi:hypothetical protein